MLGKSPSRPLAAVTTAFLLSCGGSQTEPAPPSPEPAPSVVPPAPAPSAIGTITEADLRAHVELLASDGYAGRATLTDGAAKAADYMAAEFAKYGLKPLPGRESFKVPYTLEQFRYSDEGNFIHVSAKKKPASGAKKLILGRDFTPFSFSDTGKVDDAEVVFAGYGITAPELRWDDYKGLNVKGKVVVVFRHVPDEKNEKGKFADKNHGLFTTKALNAQKHGAAAMLIVTDPLHHGPEIDDFENAGFVRLPATEKEKERLAKRRAAMAARQKGKPTLLAAHISQEAASALIATQRRGKLSLKEMQEKLDARKLKPRRIKLTARITMAIKDPVDPRPVQPENVIGYLEGSDPQLKSELVVVGGHYDHLGSGKASGDGTDVIYNGADDNASGTAGVLELAQAFASLPKAPARSLVFVGFSGEEKGLLGSFAMMRENQLEESKIAFMLNLDMIGRNADRPVEVLGDAYATTVRAVVEAANKDIGLDIKFGGTNYSGNSDHHPFYVRDIPMMFFFTGLHKDYHQLSDHADKVEFARMEQIVRLGYGVIDQISSKSRRPSFIHNLGWLGARIEVVGSGEDARATFTNIEKDARGAKAGLTAGDAITAIDGKLLKNPAKVGARFRDIEPGTTVALDILRDGKTEKISVVRAKRGFLGVFPGSITDEVRKKHGLGENEGLLIRGLTKDGPADKAGIKQDDILIRIAGVPVGLSSLGKTLARIGAGEKVGITVIRGEKRVDLTMVLGERIRG